MGAAAVATPVPPRVSKFHGDGISHGRRGTPGIDFSDHRQHLPGECNGVPNASNSATNAASLSCHTPAVDMNQFYNEALTEPDQNVGTQTSKVEQNNCCQ